MEIPFQMPFLICFFAFTTIFGKYILIDTEDKAKGKEDQHKVANESRKYVSVMLISKYGNIHHNNNIYIYIFFFIYIYIYISLVLMLLSAHFDYLIGLLYVGFSFNRPSAHSFYK